MRRIVAIDGTAGSGKSTVARLVAGRLGLAHLDTGATYRLAAHQALERGVPLDDPEKVASVAEETGRGTTLDPDGTLRFAGTPVGSEIRTPDVTAASSVVAAHPEVRRVLVELQRGLVPRDGAVVEGRDIGTVVWPRADVKAFLDARPEVRAERRVRDAGPEDADRIRRDVAERDARDAGRPVGAMRPAPDALVIDTSDRTPDEVAGLIVERAEALERHPTTPAQDLLSPVRPNRIYRVVRGLLSGLLRGPFRLDVTGAERIPARGAAILAPNHRSLIDIPVTGVISRRPVRFMAKEELFRSTAGAWFLDRMGSFPVRRGKPDRRSLKVSLEVLGAGELLGLFPEGTRRPESRFEEIEDGLAYVAMKAGVPVVPIAIVGSESVFPRDAKLPRLEKIRVLVGEPFHLGGPVDGVLKRSRIREATAISRRKLEAVMDELDPRP